MLPKLILMRHGRSAWNGKISSQAGSISPLDETGISESIQGGQKIRDVPIDVVFTSSLIRAQMTVVLALLHHSSKKVPVFLHTGQGKLEKWSHIHSEQAKQSTLDVHIASELNERMYGDLQGMNKAEMAQKFGAEQVQTWRRSFDGVPPEGESLAMTAARTLPYFQKKIIPHLEKGETSLSQPTAIPFARLSCKSKICPKKK